MRSLTPILAVAVLAGCTPPQPPPPVVDTSPSLPPPAALSAVAPAEPPQPTAAERLAPLLAHLTRSDAPQTLLLGLEVAPSQGYGPLYDSGSPKAAPDDKYRTLVVRYENGRAELAGELPFLAVPQAKGFLYMGVAGYDRDDTEAERRRHPKTFEEDTLGNNVYWYAASSLWETPDRDKVDAVRKKARERLKRARKWGDAGGEDVVYVTARAICSSHWWAQWTGGAHAFIAGETQYFRGFEKKLPEKLSAYTDDAGLLRFAREILRRRNPGEPETEISLDKPTDVGFGEVTWRKDSRACLGREKGRVYLTGVVNLPNNTARNSEWDAPVREAPPDLAPSAAAPIDLADVQRAIAFPKPKDALASPGEHLLVVQLRDRFVVYGAGASQPLLSFPAAGRIVMAEWASGDPARGWATVGDPPKAPAAEACTCDLGTVCVDGACVAPKRVFITSTTYTGDLGGLAGADAKCQERANAGALGGHYKAWLSDSTTQAKARLTHARVPYVLVDGAPVAKDWAGLVSGTLLRPIALTELAGPPTLTARPLGCGDFLVWTNTKEDGTAASADRSCRDWTDGTSGPGPDAGAVWGMADSESLWSSECKTELAGCNGSFPLFCVEQ
jgi:hypothetical protein